MYTVVQSLLQHYNLYAEVNLCGGTNDCPTFVTFTCHLIIVFLNEQVCIGGEAISIYMYCIFLNEHVCTNCLADSHRYMYFIFCWYNY